MKRVLIIFALLMLLPLISAESFTFKQGSSVNYRFRCIDLDINYYCNTSTQILFSVEDPNGLNALNNVSATTTSTFVNITLPTDKIGTYNVFGFSPSAQNTTIELKYKVTFTGSDETAFPVQLTILLIGFIGIGISYLNKRLRLMKIGGAIIAMVIGVLTIYPGYAGLSFDNVLGLLVGFVSIGVGGYYALEDFWTKDEYFDNIEDEK